jgi:hypothetical protein
MDMNNRLLRYQSQEDWERAHKGVMVQKVVCAIKNCPVDLIPFEEVRSRLHLSQKIYRGLQNIELSHIRGSVGRYTDFTSTFLPRRWHMRERWERVKLLAQNRGLPPIKVYQVGDVYFVEDGNHRVSVAMQDGQKTIEAYVWEFINPVEKNQNE